MQQIHPQISQFANGRQSEMLAHAARQRVSRQVQAHRRAARRLDRAERRMRRALRKSLLLRTEFEPTGRP